MSAQPPLPGGVSSCVSSCASCAFFCALRGHEHFQDSTPALPLRKKRLSTVFGRSGAESRENPEEPNTP